VTERLDLTFHPDAADEVRNLPTRRLQRIVLQRVVDIAKGELIGAPLNVRASTGDLSDCFKVYVDEIGGPNPRFRIVYRLLPDPAAPTTVEVIAVGRRDNLDAYRSASMRLGR
jgi:hypothetical protein